MHDRKLKVLIADDEFRIGILIKKLIRWDELNLECLQIASNGEQAFQTISEKTPDIVITDIQMPRMNGLELIASVREKKVNCKFIIVSGYKDFEYAHKAIKYGVKSYLLKPIDENELNSTLQILSDELSSENTQKERDKNFTKDINASKQIIKTDILRNLLHKRSFTKDDIADIYHISLNAPVFRVMDIKLDYWDYKNIDKKQDAITVDRIINIVDKFFHDAISDELICADDFLHIYCLLNYSKDKRENIKDLVNNLLVELEKYLLGFEMYQVTIGIGREIFDLGNIHQSVKDARKAVDTRIKRGTGRLIYSEKIVCKEDVSIPDRLGQLQDDYINAIKSYSTEDLHKSVEDIFEKITLEDRTDFSYFYDAARYLIELFYDQIEEKDENNNKTKQYLVDISQHCCSITKMKNFLKKHLSDDLERSYKRLEMKSTKPVREAKEYLDRNYKEKVTLDDIAEIVGLNPIYFSVLFKKETGKNFSAYLAHVRTEKAKDRLIHTNDTIEDIAKSVGYKDTRYFSRLFTKTVGLKPAVFRKLYS